MNYLDIIILIAVAIFVFRGLKNGLVIELATLVSLFLGVLAGIYLSDYVAGLLAKHLGLSAGFTSAVAFILIFIAVIIITRIIAKAMETAIDMTPLGFVNKLLGALFSVLKVLFFISLIFYLIAKADKKEKAITQEAKNKSYFYKPVSAIAPLTIPKIKAEYNKWMENDSIPDE